MLLPTNLDMGPTPKSSSEMLHLEVCFMEKSKLKQLKQQRKATGRKPSIEDYHLIKILGEGAFAKVIMVREKVSGKIYAMKVIHKSKINLTSDDTRGMHTAEDVAYRKMYLVK